MARTDDLTTLVCLFHHQEQAQAALTDLLEAGVPQSSISVIDRTNAQGQVRGGSSLAELGVPERDQRHLMEGVASGGSIVAVSAMAGHVEKVEEVFGRHRASKIDEIESRGRGGYAKPLAGAALAGTAMPDRRDTVDPNRRDAVDPNRRDAADPGRRIAVDGEQAIPVVQEELVVGKRTVDQGGVRIYRRVIEVPVEENVSLRDEHVNVERRPVDRAATDQDLAQRGDQTIELTETAEEAVIEKNARVVEEVRVGKEVTEKTEHIRETVRQTEVEVEQIAPETTQNRTRSRGV